jgi:rRNA maturation protein Nop10
MSQASEIKCPGCGKWTLWTGKVDDKCIHCGEFLEPERFSREAEKKLVKGRRIKENHYFDLSPTDGPVQREVKLFFNSMLWGFYYLEIAFFIFMTALLAVVGIIAA